MKTNVQGEAEERDRKVEPYLEDQLIQLADLIDMQNFTAGKKAKSRECFGPLPVTVHIMSQGGQDFKKAAFPQGFLMWRTSQLFTRLPKLSFPTCLPRACII